MAEKKDNKKDILGLAAGAGLAGGAAIYEGLPDSKKYFKIQRDIKPLSPGERILLVSSDPDFGSGHKIQAEALLKELRKRGYNNVEMKYVQEFTDKYKRGGKDILSDLYSKKIKDKSFNTQWANNYYAAQKASADELAKNLKNYDRVLVFTGDVSEALARPFSKLRKEFLKKDAPLTHLIYTDRGVNPNNVWWNKPLVDTNLNATMFYDSYFIPDEVSYEQAKNFYHKDKLNPKYVRGLTVDLDTVETPKNALKPKYFVHGGSTGVNVPETAENLVNYYKTKSPKGEALVVFGKNNPDKEKVVKVKALIDEYNKTTTGPKIHYVDALPKPEMNYYLRNAEINFGAGGTTYEELGRLGKPSLFTYQEKRLIHSHPVPIMGSSEAFDEGFKDYITMKKELKDIKGTEKGIGRLTGSELIDVGNNEMFTKRLETFEQSLPLRHQIAQQNVNTFGRGAEDIISTLEKGDSTVKYTKRIVPKSLVAAAALLGGGLAGKSLVNLVSKDEDSGWKKGLGIAAGAGLGASIALRKDIARLYKDTKFRRYNPDTPLFRNIDVLKNMLGERKSDIYKLYKNLK